MDVFDRSKEVLVTLRDALERAAPLIEGGETLIEATTELVRDTQMLVRDTRGLVTKASATLGRVDAILDAGPSLAAQLAALLKAQTELTELQRARLALEVDRAREE